MEVVSCSRHDLQGDTERSALRLLLKGQMAEFWDGGVLHVVCEKQVGPATRNLVLAAWFQGFFANEPNTFFVFMLPHSKFDQHSLGYTPLADLRTACPRKTKCLKWCSEQRVKDILVRPPVWLHGLEVVSEARLANNRKKDDVNDCFLQLVTVYDQINTFAEDD